MILGVITVLLVDVILFFIIRLLHAQWANQGQKVPLLYSIGLLILCIVAHFAATKTMSRAVAEPTQTQTFAMVLVSVAFGAVPIWAYVHMALGRIAEETERRRHTESYPRARQLRLEGDIEGALHEYLKYYESQPSIPKPLFSAAGMLEQAREFKRAAKLFQKIMEHFGQDDIAWTRAAYRLVFLQEHHLNDPEGAAFLRKQIENRIPADQRAKYEAMDLDSTGSGIRNRPTT